MRALSKEERIASRYIPSGSTEKTREGVDAVCYKQQFKTGVWAVMYYKGTAGKHCGYVSYKSEQVADDMIEKFFDNCVAVSAYHKERAEARKAPHTYKVGDILQGSWGYEQTNQEFWIVESVTPRTVMVCQIGQMIVEATGYMSETVTADPSRRIGSPKKAVVSDGAVRVHDCCRCWLWDGKPKYQSHYA